MVTFRSTALAASVASLATVAGLQTISPSSVISSSNRPVHHSIDMITVPLSTGAACMDGSPYKFILRPGDPERWSIFMVGGGWCNNPEICKVRPMELASSTMLTPLDHGCNCFMFNEQGVPLDCTCAWLIYCDGASFSGNRADPIVAKDGTKLLSRGRFNLVASIDLLLKEYGLDKATHLVLSGQSAGGLSTMLHLDAVAARMPSRTKVMGVPSDGFFLDHVTVDGRELYANEMQEVYELHNVRESLSAQCLADFAKEPWRCLYAPYIVKYIKTPLFVLNSKYDQYQLAVNFALNSEHGGCGGAHLDISRGDECTKELVADTLQYGKDFMQQIDSFVEAAKTNKSANGVFISSCICHGSPICRWNRMEVNGVSMPVALGKWQNGGGSAIYIDERRPNYNTC